VARAPCFPVCLLAAGQLDAILEVDLYAHDVMPLIPIIEGAGGVITEWNGKPCTDGGDVLACGNAAL
jgi:myo-inositol-1(or 4)-monophosphatase